MNTISVVINTYNAELHLEKVIHAAKGFDEILVCDMESTDSTVDIAERNGCRVVVFPKGDNTIVEPARQFAIESATSEWVLVIDADEMVTSQLRDYLYKRISVDDCPHCIWLPRKNRFMGRFMHSTYPDYIPRFLHRESVHWPPTIHSAPVVKGRQEKVPSSRMDLAIEHLANDTVAMRMAKINTYTDNEVVRRSAKNYALGALLWRPFFRFFKSYFLKGGFRDGIPGFIWAVNEAVYQFVLVSKMIERN
ncbi:MAG: glycosyltransferase family 2 protein [Bacteroidaceae bacterium]|nr:glycosyltransferase family 2 protein [Bacteroidaceae bacterium]